MSVEKCKELLEEVTKLCASIGPNQGSTSNSSTASRSSPGVRSTPSVSAVTSSLTSSQSSRGVAFEEHRRLFGFNPTTTAASALPRNRKRKIKSASSKKEKQRPTWTRTFVCLGDISVEKMPTPNEYRLLKAANLGEKRITLFADSSAIEVDTKLKEMFPKLETAGGYTLLCGGSYSRNLDVINPPYNIPRLKEQFVGQGKLFIRPLQRGLDMSASDNNCEDEEEDDLLEECMKCNKLFYLFELGQHVENCRHGEHDSQDASTSNSDVSESIRSRPALELDGTNTRSESPNSPQLMLVSETQSSPQLLPDYLSTHTEVHLILSESIDNTSTSPVPVPHDNSAIDEDPVTPVVVSEPNIASDKADRFTGTSIDEVAQETIRLCQTSSIANNPVEMLRVLQSNMVTGRPLDIEDPSQEIEGETNQIFVDRFRLLKTGMDEIKALEDKRLTLEVQFYNEKAVDLGGPRKEFFLMILREIKEKYFDDGINENKEDEYHTVGVILALSMLQNGKLPRFIKEEFLQEIFTDDNPSPCMLAVRNGLSELGIYQVVKEVPLLMHLFRKVETASLTVKQITCLLDPEFSEEGSNSRKFQGEVYSIFIKYLREVASGRRGDLTLEHILQFTTGVDEEPVLGFTLHPKIVFVEATGCNFIPTANTCINCLTIPRASSTTPLLQVPELHNLYDFAFGSSFFGML